MQERVSPSASAEQIVSFEGLLVVVGGGKVDLGLLSELYLHGGHLVGADGGADLIVLAGLTPEAIIGDFDSLENPLSWLGRTRLIQLVEQQTTDFEKALYSTEAPVTVALGMTGTRFDHTLAALDAVARQAKGRPIILVDEADIAIALWGEFAYAVGEGERVSVHPLTPIRFKHSEGLQYPLDGIKLAPGQRTGTSNAALTGPFRIVPEPRTKGPYLLVLDRSHLFGVIDALLESTRS